MGQESGQESLLGPEDLSGVSPVSNLECLSLT